MDAWCSDIWRNRGTHISPVCAVIGGLIGAEILKVLSGRDEPLDNVIVYDSVSSSAVVKHVQP